MDLMEGKLNVSCGNVGTHHKLRLRVVSGVGEKQGINRTIGCIFDLKLLSELTLMPFIPSVYLKRLVAFGFASFVLIVPARGLENKSPRRVSRYNSYEGITYRLPLTKS